MRNRAVWISGIGVAAAAAAITATSASAASPAKAAAPSVKNTSQNFYTNDDGVGGYTENEEIEFGTKTFLLPSAGETGTFKQSGTKLTFTITQGRDEGCSFPGVDLGDGYFRGEFTCTSGRSAFAVGTTGYTAPSAHGSRRP